jgi:hypothetical protein
VFENYQVRKKCFDPDPKELVEFTYKYIS